VWGITLVSDVTDHIGEQASFNACKLINETQFSGNKSKGYEFALLDMIVGTPMEIIAQVAIK
jgi:hypothetical protein